MRTLISDNITRRFISFLFSFLCLFFLFSPNLYAAPTAQDVRNWMLELNSPGLDPLKKKQLTAQIFYHCDVYRDAAMQGVFPPKDAAVDNFLNNKKLLIQDVIQETNNRYRGATGSNIKGPVIPFEYNNIYSDDDVILSSGREGKKLESTFNESLSDILEERTGNPFSAADRKRIDINGLSWDMTQQGAMENFFHPEKYVNPQSGFANQTKLGSAGDALYVAGFDKDGRLVRLNPDQAKDAVSSLLVDKPLAIDGVNPSKGAGSMTDYWRMATIHQIKFKGHLPPGDIAQFIRNQKYTERLAGDFAELAANSNPKLAKKYKEFIELSAQIRKQLTIKDLARIMEKAYGESLIVNGQLGQDGMEKLKKLMVRHQARQLAMMPELVGAVAKTEAGAMMSWLKKGLGNRILLRKQLALTYAPYDDQQIKKIVKAVQDSDLDRKDIAWIESVLDKDRRQLRRYAQLLEIGPETLKARMKLTGDNVAIVDFISSRNAKIIKLSSSVSKMRGGKKLMKFARSATGRALNMDVILEGSTSSRVILGSMMLLAMTRAHGAATREEGMKAVGMALFEMIPIVSGVLRMSEMNYKAAIREFVFDACPPMALAYIAGAFLNYSANIVIKLFTDSIWDNLVHQALNQLNDDDFEKTSMGFYRLKDRRSFLNYLDDVSAGFGRIAKLASMIAPQVEALMERNEVVKRNNAALHTVNYLEQFDLEALKRQVRSTGMPAKGAASPSARVAAKLILENEEIRKSLEIKVLSDFIDKIEKEYNKRKRDDDDDFDPSALVQKARRLLREAYEGAPQEIKDSPTASEDLKNTYRDYIGILINHPTEGKEKLQLEQELLDIVDQFKAYIDSLMWGLEIWDEASALNLQLEVFGGDKGIMPSDKVVLGDSFRLAISGLVQPKRAKLAWTAFFYLHDPNFGNHILLGKQSLSPSAFNPGNDGLWPIESHHKSAQFHITRDKIAPTFEQETNYEFMAILAFGAWGGDPLSTVGSTAMQYPAQYPDRFSKDKIAFMSSNASFETKRVRLRLKVPSVVFADKDAEVKAYMEIPEYAKDYIEKIDFEIIGPDASAQSPEITPTQLTKISIVKEQPTILKIRGDKDIKEAKYMLKGLSKLLYIFSDFQPNEAIKSFEFSTATPDDDDKLADTISELKVVSADPKKKKLTTAIELIGMCSGKLIGEGTHTLNLSWDGGNVQHEYTLKEDEDPKTFSEKATMGQFKEGTHTLTATLSKDGTSVEKSVTFEVKPEGAFVIENMRVASLSGKGNPKTSEGVVARADVKVKDFDGQIGLEWQRASDGESEIQVMDVSPDVEFEAKKEFGPLASGQKPKKDKITLTVSDGGDISTSASVSFKWEEGDEFTHFIVVHAKDGKMGGRFTATETINITSAWKIAKGDGSARKIKYLANGGPFSEADVSVPEGKSWSHNTSLDLKTLPAGTNRLELTAELFNPKTKATATGAKTIMLKEGKDEIVGAGASSAPGGSFARSFKQGDPIYIVANVLAAEGVDGERVVTLSFAGKERLRQSTTLEGGKNHTYSFPINSGALKIPKTRDYKSFTFLVKLFNESGKKQDWQHVTFKLVKKKSQPQQQNTGGMQNIYCTSPNITLKVWDHASQDDDIISLRLGTDVVLSNFNLNACGGREPAGGPCLHNRSLQQGRMAVSVYAHNEGSSPPNTASLKVDGGCTPEKQNWSLKKGQTGNIWVFYGAPPQ